MTGAWLRDIFCGAANTLLTKFSPPKPAAAGAAGAAAAQAAVSRLQPALVPGKARPPSGCADMPLFTKVSGWETSGIAPPTPPKE
jgi:hypothetical protein